MEFFADNILLIMFLPLWVILVITAGVIFKMSGNRKFTVFLTLLSTFTGLIFSLGLFNYVRIPNTLVIEKNILWLSFENLNLYLGTLIDANSTSFLVILMIISFLVQLYSYGYMKNKEEFSRYYIYLNFFNFSMTGLILSSNLFQMYLFWELVGVASYLLIGYFHKRDDVSAAAKRVFIVNRIGDCAFLAGIIIFIYFSVSYLNQTNADILAFTAMNTFTNKLSLAAYPLIFDAACMLILIGGFVKSVQFPFHLWIIDAMKAPVPVSALIHSATMVCMGIYLTIRIYPLLTTDFHNIILLIGIITALLCAFIAVSQTNIKKMLAYSTSSQLGLIFAALGLFSVPVAIIYLIIHSFTKALLFLCAGMIEQKFNGSQNMLEMGNLGKSDFYISLYWIVGALSLSGLFFGGFTSKEMLINLAHNSNNMSVLFIILLTSYLSTFYISKAYFMIFLENNKKDIQISNRKEKTMTAAITILCIFVIFPGFIFKITDLNYLCIIAVLIGILAIVNAYASYKCRRILIPESLYKLSYNELYIPQIYNFIQLVFSKVYQVTIFTEKKIFDEIYSFCAHITCSISNMISRLQNGNIQSYIAYSLFSTGIIVSVLVVLYLIAAGV